MRSFTLLLLLFLFAGASFSELYAQSLVIRLHDGSETTELVKSVQKLSFSDDNILVSFKTGSIDSYLLSDVQKLYFDINESVPESQASTETKLSVYPNPAEQKITLHNIPEGTSEVFIYRTNGKLILKKLVSTSIETINVADLQRGMYILIAGSMTVKFIKL
jgi:hypothetical protein